MRFVFLSILLIGMALGLGSPWLAGRQDPALTFGRWLVLDASGAYQPVDAPLSATDGSIRLWLDLTVQGPAELPAAGSLATVTVAQDGRTLLAEAVGSAGAMLSDSNPQTPERVLRVSAGTIEAGTHGPFVITVGPGDIDLPAGTTIELSLARTGWAADPRLQPVGFTLMAVGFVGFVLAASRRRREEPSDAVVAPVPSRWGRNAKL